MISEVKLVVGLGNPGKKYDFTRHNLGFLVVESLARRYRLKFKAVSKIQGLLAEGTIEDFTVHLLLPQTFVNHSGIAVKATLSSQNLGLRQLLVVVDDTNLDFKVLRFRPDGSDGGHNGLKSIIEHLQTKEFARLRLGVGKPSHESLTEFVLGVFKAQEKKELPEFVEQATDYCVNWVCKGN